jgi:putative hydrolase of the HAD superfamily
MNIVFDFGAVVFAWQPRLLVAQAFPMEAATPEKAAELAHRMFGHPDWLSFDRGTLPMHSVIERMAERLGLDLAAVTELVQSIGAQLVPIDETLALLNQLRLKRAQSDANLRLYFLSNMSIPFARTLERKYEFLSWFDGGIFSGDVQLVKPEPEIYALLENRYQLQAAETIFIDDLLVNIEAAKTRGWQGIQFESAVQLQTDLQTLMS